MPHPIMVPRGHRRLHGECTVPVDLLKQTQQLRRTLFGSTPQLAQILLSHLSSCGGHVASDARLGKARRPRVSLIPQRNSKARGRRRRRILQGAPKVELLVDSTRLPRFQTMTFLLLLESTELFCHRPLALTSSRPSTPGASVAGPHVGHKRTPELLLAHAVGNYLHVRAVDCREMAQDAADGLGVDGDVVAGKRGKRVGGNHAVLELHVSSVHANEIKTTLPKLALRQ
mmetsp:Transcript_13881/g.44462  ORF Transcript_13881/g.44462 Transcript_13881/m.44462 type:complete len:229 (+) Transcript_13881:690-1376(+)